MHAGRNFAVRGPDSTEEQRGLGECDGAVATAGEGRGVVPVPQKSQGIIDK